MSEVIDMFGLTKEETCLLFSMQSYLIREDVLNEGDAIYVIKDQWHNEWKENVEAMLRGIQGEEGYSTLFRPLELNLTAKNIMDKGSV